MGGMYGASLVLTVALSGLSVPGAALRASGVSWVTATALAARAQGELGVSAQPAVGYSAGRPYVLAVADVAGVGPVQMEVGTLLAFRKMERAAARAGVRLLVVSGFRTQERQRELYRLFRRGQGPLASLPGHSNHQSGHAVDLDMSLPGVKLWLKRNARHFGFKRTVPSERWHWEHW